MHRRDAVDEHARRGECIYLLFFKLALAPNLFEMHLHLLHFIYEHARRGEFIELLFRYLVTFEMLVIKKGQKHPRL